MTQDINSKNGPEREKLSCTNLFFWFRQGHLDSSLIIVLQQKHEVNSIKAWIKPLRDLSIVLGRGRGLRISGFHLQIYIPPFGLCTNLIFFKNSRTFCVEDWFKQDLYCTGVWFCAQLHTPTKFFFAMPGTPMVHTWNNFHQNVFIVQFEWFAKFQGKCQGYFLLHYPL